LLYIFDSHTAIEVKHARRSGKHRVSTRN